MSDPEVSGQATPTVRLRPPSPGAGRPADAPGGADAPGPAAADPTRLDSERAHPPEVGGGAAAGPAGLRDAPRAPGTRARGPDRPPRLPDVGDELFGYRLRRPLGRGAFARVFIAEQPDLAGRPVVLKVSAIEGIEPQALARLQHTNIVPIYSVHEDAGAGLRAVCMPYFGGASLASVLEQLWAAEARPTEGAQLVEALERAGAPPPADLARSWGLGRCAPVPAREGAAEEPAPLSQLRAMGYVEAVAWTVAQLADGLHHAHERGILHRDIKPSNILLGADGQPLLLDFNVSQDARGEAAEAVLGGTVAYAAPEHLRALIARTPEAFARVDRRSDVYALGLVLAEMLTGRRPFEQAGSYSVEPARLEAMAVERGGAAPSVRRSRPDVPWGLESVVRKCLEPDPARRYARADHLADDLRRLLDDRPLRHAPELSRAERVRKFVRRHPRLTTSASVCAAALVGLLAVGSALAAARGHLAETRDRLREARARLVATRARDRKRAHDAGFVRALCLVNTTLGDRDHLRRGAAVCEETLALYDVAGGGPLESHPDWPRLDPEERRRLAEDRRELLLLLAGARARLAPGDATALRHALALLDRAEAIRGLAPSKALRLDRAGYLAQLGDDRGAAEALARAEAVPASGARDHYLLAISHARRGGADGYRRAVAELDEALRLNPRHYWSTLQRGICRMELGEAVPAAGDFGACTGLWPEHPWGYFNRGYVLDRSGRKAEAIDDYTAALARDPELVPALVNRGLARLELRRHDAALADFDAALRRGSDDPAVHAGRGIALEGLGRHAEADDAFRDAFARAPDGPARDRLLWTYAFAVADRRPAEAADAFDAVLRRDPRHPQALYGRAMLAMRDARLDEALGFFDRALAANPDFPEARRHRAIARARRGDWERAGRDLDRCLGREPASGEDLYAAACVAALAAGASGDPRSADRALDLLRRARGLGAGPGARDDPDLAALRRDPRFHAILSDAPDRPVAGRRDPTDPET